MTMLRFLPPVFALLLVSTPVLACSPAQQENLLTGVLYREAHPNRADQAAIASVVFNRMSSPHFRGSLCKVVTQPGQFQYRVHVPGKKVDTAKLNLARTNAILFLNEYNTHRAIVSEAGVFRRLKGFDSFNTSGQKVGAGKREQIGGNTFYKSTASRRN